MAQVVAQSGKLAPGKVKGAWGMLAIVWLAYFSQPLNTVKASVLAPALMEYFGFGEDVMSIAMSLFYIIGFVLAFPSAGLINKLGLKKTGIVAIAAALIGGLIGVFSPNVEVFMASRFIEGIGMGVFGVVGITAITPWFAPSKRGLPMALWGMCVTVAFLVGPALFAAIYESVGDWRVIWWIIIAITAVVLVLFTAFYREAKFGFDENEQVVELSKAVSEEGEVAQASFASAIKTPLIWILGIMMLCYAAASMALENFLPTYVNSLPNFSLTTAGLIASGGAVTGAICAFLAGVISDKIHSRKIVMLIGFIAAIVYACMLFKTTTVPMFILVLWILGVGENFSVAMIYSSMSEAVAPEKLAFGSAMLVFMLNLGQFIGTTVIGFVFTALGDWGMAALVVPVPLYVVGLVLTLIFWKKLP